MAARAKVTDPATESSRFRPVAREEPTEVPNGASDLCILAFPVSLMEKLIEESKARGITFAELISKSLSEFLLNHPINR